MNLLSALAVLGALVLLYRTASKWTLDVVGVFCIGVFTLYVSRALVIGAGLDELSPDTVFAGGPSAVVEANLLLALWLVMIAAGVQVAFAVGQTAPGLFPVIEMQPSPRRYQRVAAALTAMASLVTVLLLAAYGGFDGLIRASKVDKELAGLFFVRMLPEVAAVVCVAAFLDVLRRRDSSRPLGGRDRVRAWSSAGMAMLNGVWVFGWGSRDTLAIVVLALASGAFVFGRSHSARSSSARLRHRRGLWLRIGLSGVAVLALVLGLRLVRDVATSGSVNSAIAGQTTVRQLSVAANAVQYDAFVLAVRDWPSVYEHRGGEDFSSGAAGVVPRRLWPDKPEHVAPGSWFREQYEPWTRNGWPMGAAGEWYLDFGRLGIVVGGLVSGVLLGFASLALRNSARHPLAFVFSMVVGLQVLVLGYHVQTPVRWVSWCLPFFVVSLALHAGRRRVPVSAPSRPVRRPQPAGAHR